MTFLNGLKRQLNTTQTSNGAITPASTLDSNLDLFGKIGSSRSNVEQAVILFHAAYAENPETATRILFYARDIRGGKSANGGQGERAVFRAIFKELAITDPNIASKLISLVPIFGRWDDLLVLEDTSLWQDVLNLYASQLKADVLLLKQDKPISLLAKWLPSINASSTDTKRLAKKVARFLEMTDQEYRKLLVALRSKIAIVEQQMCAKQWSNINYEQVPSKAGLMYRKAFQKHDETRYAEYLVAVKKGEKKINAATLYPYDICIPALGNSYSHQPKMDATERAALDVMWNALPNYMEGTPFNGLVLADVSGSMYDSYSTSKTRPIDVSVSLAVYIAEKNTGIWANTFMAFDSEPRLAKVSGNDFYSKLQSVKSSTSYMGSTNLMGAIKSILDAGVKNNLTQEEMPQCLIVISDMQFDQACKSNKKTNFEQIQKEYKKAGYTIPSIIFWNVNASTNVPMTKDDAGTALVSGCSPSILKSILNARFLTPIDLMNDCIYNERYAPIGEVFS
jgi:hypothetical protein